MSRAREAAELDSVVLSAIDAWHRSGRSIAEAEFDDIALALFAHQLRYNHPYARFCASFGFSLSALPEHWQQIPALPASAFKEARIASFEAPEIGLHFESSGTTADRASIHHIENPALYDTSLLAGFDRFMLADGAALRYALLVPNPAQRPHSSLGYMMAKVATTRGDGQTGWYLDDDNLLVDAFIADVSDAVVSSQPLCIATTAFALLHLLEELEARSLVLTLPRGSRIMETGGFKGRARSIERTELYARTCARFAVAQDAILAEYGMSELCSQYYDDLAASGSLANGTRIKRSPPWLRTRILDERGIECAEGVVGALAHLDLANRSSCIAILTEDLGARVGNGILLMGRDRGAELRGCSLDAEGLRAI